MKAVSESLPASGSRENWISLLETAAREVFELMLGSHLTVPVAAEAAGALEITAMVGLAGRLCGVLSVQCQGRAAALMTSKMIGVEPEKLGPEVLDGLGEVCNMVAGNFKNKIAGLADGCMLSPPTVIAGRDYHLRSLAGSPAFEVNLLFEGMLIVVSLRIHS
jgi:chemotaxis protein CheX